ncbi:MAG: spondin domain-containing protein [Pseudomonadota bacterium]
MNLLKKRAATTAGAIGIGLLTASAANALTLKVEIENLQNPNGLSLTPFLSVFHDGGYDLFDVGGSASAGLEAIAEEGNTSVETAQINNDGSAVAVNTIASPDGPPVFLPGQSASLRFDVGDVVNLFFSYASMVIPSNDLFVGNSNPTARQVITDGVFNALTFDIGIDRIYDGGTEENNNLGAAFNPNGGTATDTDNPIALLSALGQDVTTLLGGQPTLAGFVVDGGAINPELARISISVVPVPAALPLGLSAFALLGLVARRRIA